MLNSIEVSGKTEEEAIASALAQLGLDRDDVSIEIIERAKSGFLGIGASPAVVRVSYEAAPEAAEDDTLEGRVREFLTGLLEHMGVEAEMEISEKENGALCVNLTGENKEVQVNLPGFGGKTALGTLLTGELSGENTFEKDTVLPEKFQKALDDKGFAHTFPAHSVTAFRIG